MKNERKNTVLSIVIDALVTFAKIYAGLIFNSYTLVVSGYNSLLDASLSFTAYTGSIFRGRRANKKEPFGYGKKEHITLIILGIFIIALGLFIIGKSFFLNYKVTDLKILVPLFIISMCLLVFANYLFKMAKQEQSIMLIDISHDNFYDGVITIISVFFIFLSNFIPIFDMLGCIFGGIVFVVKGLNIVINNILLIYGQNDQSKVVAKNIKKYINEVEGIKYSNCNLINVKNFYKVTIEVLIKDDVSLNDLILWEEYQRSNIKASKLNIKYIEYLIYKDN